MHDMKKEIQNNRIKEIIHNIAEDFRFSSEHEKYAQLFYAAEAMGALDAKMHADMLEYVQTSMKELKKDIAWKEKFLEENPEIDEAQVLITMRTIEKEYEELLTYLTMSGI